MKSKKRSDRIKRLLLDETEIDTFEPEYLKVDATGRIHLRGVTKIALCQKDKMELTVKNKRLVVEGSDLVILTFSRNETVIDGTVSRILWGKESGSFDR